MRQIVIFMAALAVSAVTLSARDLQFRKDRSFRIAQFTDMHLNASTPYKEGQADKTFARLSRVVNEEKPDVLMFTGDIVTGKPALGMWNRLIDSLNVYKIPFCVMFGNHDAEQELTRQQIAQIVTGSPYSLNTLNSDGELDDVELPVMSSKAVKGPQALLYCMDSHDYATIEGLDGYGWFTYDQVAWIRDRCNARTSANGGKPVPSLAFFHICLQEYETAWKNRSNSHIGRAAESECPGVLNTGMYSAMVEGGSVMGCFVGHDHDIDYVVAQYGIALGYGRYSGDDTVYNNLRPGVRMIVLREGLREFESWIVEDDGRIVDHIDFNGKITKHK
ncbi:MAG: metallophosphoesterase family protein [Bacteroidales bacterium]|nr:metallophosphoesterase family protein [Bacteroidales bacterium]